MKIDIRKIKIISLFLTVLISGFLKTYGQNNPKIVKESLKKIPGNQMAETDSEKCINSMNYTLALKKVQSGFEVVIMDGKAEIFYQNYPARITVRGEDTISMGNYVEKEYANAYKLVTREKYGFRALAEISTDNGSTFIIEDKYTLQNGTFILYRNVKVGNAEKEDAGFASTVSFLPKLNSSTNTDYEYFIPSILYRNTSEVRQTAIAADLNVDRMYVKETRTGLPLAMIREKESGNSLTLMHYKPVIDIKENPGGGLPGEVNNELRYGSIGYTMQPLISIDFRYPCAEGPRRYDLGWRITPAQPAWSKKYHPVQKGNQHSYSIAIIPDNKNSYNDAMVNSFNTGFKVEEPDIVEVNMSDIYNQNIELFKAEYREYGKSMVKAAGLPWSLDLPNGKNTEGVTFQMGFVGQQIAVGYHLYRYGLDNNDNEAKIKGKTIVDFWTSDPIMSTYFPTVWWVPADNETVGKRREYPSFLRCFVDGMEGLLDACRISDAYGEPQTKWENELKRVASNLVNKQNEDGSFYRAYKTNGEVETGGNRNTQGDSKLNTPIAVRFLVKMYEYTGDEKYKEAAVKAALFSYNEIYLKLGKYVGGTPDNPNTVDKEAAIFALYCFNAIYELTGEGKYLKAAEHSAACAMSWTYCYDFSIPNRNEDDQKKNPFSKGGILGFSIIATGHSGADNFISYMFYEMYKLYIKTGNEQYLYMAKFLQNDTKSNTDFNGRMGYKYHAFMPEATNVADLAFQSVSLWLPWASIANIEPIVNLEEAFGQKDLFKIDKTLTDLRTQLSSYGVGGKPLKRKAGN